MKTTLIRNALVYNTWLRRFLPGWLLIEGERVNVMTDGDFIAENKPVVVTRVEGNSVFVRARA